MINIHLTSLLKENKNTSGFTLIELLIVIAVIGVLATVVLVAINPLEQLARARDAGRKSTLSQVSKSAQAYFTIQGTAFPDETAFLTTLKTTGELKQIPSTLVGTYGGGIPACAGGTNGVTQNGYCYRGSSDTAPTNVIMYVRMESDNESSKCATTVPDAFFLWSSTDARAGIICMAAGTEPDALTYTAASYK